MNAEIKGEENKQHQCRSCSTVLLKAYFLKLELQEKKYIPARVLMFQHRSKSSTGKDSVAPPTRIPAEFTKTSKAI